MKGVQARHMSNFSDFRDCQNAFVGVIDLLVSGSKYNQVFRLVIKFDIFSRSKLLSPTETAYWTEQKKNFMNWAVLESGTEFTFSLKVQTELIWL